LGVCKLRDYCRKCSIPGYSTSYKKGGLDGLAEFLIKQQIYAHMVEHEIKRLEMSAY
jgi:hypothetical protein